MIFFIVIIWIFNFVAKVGKYMTSSHGSWKIFSKNRFMFKTFRKNHNFASLFMKTKISKS